MENKERKGDRYPSEGIVTYRVIKESDRHEVLVQVINRSTSGIGVIYSGKNPPKTGETVMLFPDDNPRSVQATLKWKKEIFENIYILGFSFA